MAQLFGEALKKRGMSQLAFCRLADENPKTVNQVINGRSSARPDTLDRWAAAIGLRYKIELVPLEEKQ